MDKRYMSADGYPITDGCILWNYYDLVRVMVRLTPAESAHPDNAFHESWDGWFTCVRMEGGGLSILNGERLAMFHPFTRERAVPEEESGCNCSNPYCQV